MEQRNRLGGEYRAPNKCSLWVTLMLMMSVASKALAHELVNSGVSKPQSLQNIWSCQMQYFWSTLGKRNTLFKCLLLWRAILTANKKLVGCSISSFQFVRWNCSSIPAPKWSSLELLTCHQPLLAGQREILPGVCSTCSLSPGQEQNTSKLFKTKSAWKLSSSEELRGTGRRSRIGVLGYFSEIAWRVWIGCLNWEIQDQIWPSTECSQFFARCGITSLPVQAGAWVSFRFNIKVFVQ